jgi:DNA-binding MarR family transcriptional regulator
LRRGRQLIDEVVVVAHVENEARLLAGLTAGEQRELNALLRKLLLSLGG